MIVPWRESDPARKAPYEFVVERIGRQLLDAELVVADDPRPTFNRGRALNAGVARAAGDVLVFVDADMVVPDEAIYAALDAVGQGAAMVVPFRRLLGLTGPASELVITGRSAFGPWGPDQVDLEWDRPSAGGMNVIRRDVFERVGGFDERFAGWGGEDAAFSIAVGTLAGPVEWVAATAVHLWHPWSPDRGSARTEANMNLARRYEDAWGIPDAMCELINQR